MFKGFIITFSPPSLLDFCRILVVPFKIYGTFHCTSADLRKVNALRAFVSGTCKYICTYLEFFTTLMFVFSRMLAQEAFKVVALLSTHN